MDSSHWKRNGANLILHISEDLDRHTAAQISRTIDVFD